MVGRVQRGMGGVEIHRLGRQRGLRLLAVVVHDLRHGLVDQPVQGLDRLDGARPVVLGFVDTDQRTQRGQRIAGVLELLERPFGAVQHAGLQEILRQFVLCVLALGHRQVGAAQ
ncbi:Uncharacterised protein [Bordetella pertussis]|nr:Uncharacterised protein [Bordetella pertussis]